MSQLNWIKELNWKKDLKGDMREIAEHTSIEVLISLWEMFGKTSVYFSEDALNELRRKYIIMHFNKGKVKEIARKLDTSQSFVYSSAKGVRRKKKIVN